MKDKEQTKPIIKWGHETELVDIEWCWKPYLPYGKVSIIEGDGGDGKTTMILTIAALLSQGCMPPSLIRGHLVEEPDCSPITTFYLTNEDEVADSSLKRFIRAGGDRSRFAYSGELQHHMTITEDELYSAIEETKCRLLIIDPFQAFLPEGTNLGSITRMRAPRKRCKDGRRRNRPRRASQQERGEQGYSQRVRQRRHRGFCPQHPHGGDGQEGSGETVGKGHQEQF